MADADTNANDMQYFEQAQARIQLLAKGEVVKIMEK